MPTQDPAGTIKTRVRAPGFDGLRALAVLAVMAFHEQFTAVPGGFLGVDIFFVLSGYLITDLLVAHRQRRGHLDLRGFWVRRARRLLPALAVVLVTVTAAAAVIEPDQLGQLRPALVAAATYSSNWWQIWHHQPYFMVFGPPPLLKHLWSLAIEEQFYLAWPLILAVLLALCARRRTRAAVAWLAAAASAVVMAAAYSPGADPTRVYYGTDTHATALLIGTAVALTWPLNKLMSASTETAKRFDLAGVIGLAVLAWTVGHFYGTDAALYPAGLVIAALAAAGVVLGAAAQGTVSQILSCRPLRWLGVRSYGIYLWHWPVIALTAAVTGPGPGNGVIWVIETGAAIALAAASWRWIETPILTNGFRATMRAGHQALIESVSAVRSSPLRAIPALALVAALTLACTAGYRVLRAPATTSLEQQILQGERVSGTTRTVGADAAAGTAIAATGSVTTAPAGAVGNARPPRVWAAMSSRQAGALPGRPHSWRQKIFGSRVTAIGDSVMLAAAPELKAALRGVYIDARISRQMGTGLRTVTRLADSGLLRPVVVVGLGTNGPVTSQQMRQLVTDVGPHRKLVLVNTFVPRPWKDEVNNAFAAAARGHANVVLANWCATIEDRTSLLWGDRVHPRPAGAQLYAQMVVAAVRASATHRRPGAT